MCCQDCRQMAWPSLAEKAQTVSISMCKIALHQGTHDLSAGQAQCAPLLVGYLAAGSPTPCMQADSTPLTDFSLTSSAQPLASS